MKYKIRYELVTAFLIVFSIYFLKPTYLGISLTPVGLILLVILSVKKRYFTLNNRTLNILIGVLIYNLYVIFLNAISNAPLEELLSQTKALVTCLAAVFLLSKLLESSVVRFYFFRIFISLFVLFSFSYIITFILGLTIPYRSLMYINESVTYDSNLQVFFPFTPAHLAVINAGGFSFLRLHGGLRECGIGQVFFLWSYVVYPKVFCTESMKSKICWISLLFGAFFCMSTMGFINIIVVLFLQVIIRKDVNLKYKILITLFLLVILYTVLTVPGLRFEDKNFVSTTARVDSFYDIVQEWLEHPIFGGGYNVAIRHSTSLLQMLNRIGIFGIILYFVPFYSCYKKVERKDIYIIALAPLILTILFSQPIWEAPMIYILLLFFIYPIDYHDIYKELSY